MGIVADLVAVLCAPGPRGGLGVAPLAGLFLAGLAGGVVHCAPMCGAFVLGQVGAGLARLPAGRLCEAHRVSQALLVPYHLGRLTTYAGLGAASASVGAGLDLLGGSAGLRGVALSLAALLFLGLALRRFISVRGRRYVGSVWLGWASARVVSQVVGHVVGRWDRGGYMRGVPLGFLPCGLVYAALLMAGATADPLAGAVAMAVFGLGTVPALLGVGLVGHAAGRRWGGVRWGSVRAMLGPLVLAVNAMLLGVLAWRMFQGFVAETG